MSALPPSDPATEAHVRHLIATHVPRSPIYALLLTPPPAVAHASPGRVVVRLPLRPAHLNAAGSAHGGALATLVDWAGGLAIASHDGRERTGVSVDVHVAYLAGAPRGRHARDRGPRQPRRRQRRLLVRRRVPARRGRREGARRLGEAHQVRAGVGAEAAGRGRGGGDGLMRLDAKSGRDASLDGRNDDHVIQSNALQR